MDNTKVLPKVGDGATYSAGSDRYPATVIKVSKAGVVTIQDDSAELVSGSTMSERQEWTYSPNPNGSTHTVRYNERGKFWRIVNGGSFVHFGSRRKYSDPCF